MIVIFSSHFPCLGHDSLVDNGMILTTGRSWKKGGHGRSSSAPGGKAMKVDFPICLFLFMAIIFQFLFLFAGHRQPTFRTERSYTGTPLFLFFFCTLKLRSILISMVPWAERVNIHKLETTSTIKHDINNQ